MLSRQPGIWFVVSPLRGFATGTCTPGTSFWSGMEQPPSPTCSILTGAISARRACPSLLPPCTNA